MKLKIIVTLAFISLFINFACLAQNLNLIYSDGSVAVPLENASSATIDAASGDINVTTSASSADIGNSLGLQPTGSTPVISYAITANGTTSADINATISNDAVYCNKTGQWSGLTTSNPPTTFVTNISETVTVNSTDYTISCANSFGISSNSATVSNIVIVSAPVVTISASPTQVNSGDSSTVSWSVTNSPSTCTFTGDWPVGTGTGALTPSNFPASSFSITNILNAKSLNVSCTNTAGTDSSSVQITLFGSTTWPSCTGLGASILGGNEDRTVIANATSIGGLTDGTFNQLWGTSTDPNAQFPVFYGNNLKFSLTRGSYIAAQFNSGTANALGVFSFTTPGNFAGPSSTALTVSISACPGDFNEHLGQSKCKGGGVNGTFRWSDLPTADPNQYCIIQPNTTYYLNFVHALEGGNNYQTSACGSSYCGQIVTPQKLN